MYSGNEPAGVYVRWRTKLLDKIGDHPLESVRISAILHCISEPERSKVKRELKLSPVTSSEELIARLDRQHLTVSEKAALVNEWVDVSQKPGESAYAYVQRFEELVHLRRITHPDHGPIHDMDLLSMLRRGFTDPVSRSALSLIDPTGKMSYEGYKSSLLAFLSSVSQSGASNAVVTLTPSTLAPITSSLTSKPKREDKHSRLKPKLSDDSPVYANVRSAITRQLGIADRGCLRCGKEGHYARDCTSQSIYRFDERCKVCGGLNMVDGKAHQCKVSKRRIICTSCGQSGHMSSICPTAKTSSTPATSRQTAADQLSSQFPVTSSSSRTARVDVRAGQSVLADLPKLPEVSLRLGFDHQQAFCDVRALLDSGANASLMRDHLVDYFIDRGIIRHEDMTVLESPVSVGGISETVIATHTVRVAASSGDLKNVEFTFLVCRGIDNTIILGANMYPKLGIGLTSTNKDVIVHNLDSTVGGGGGSCAAKIAKAEIIEQLEPLITVSDRDDGGKQLTAHVEVFRRAAMMPFRSPPRKRSETNDRIVHHRLTTMARENKVSRCREEDLIMICPVVIVDKDGADSLRSYPDPRMDERYRITLDLRSVNSLSLAYDNAGSFVLLPSKNANGLNTVAAFDTKSYRQSELTLRRLRSVPSRCSTYYKLDLRDAYSSIAVDESLQRCFGVVSYDVNNNPCFWAYRVLPQGWQWSGLLFGVAMEFMVSKIQDCLRMRNIPAKVIHCKDDVILASCCQRHAAEALACARECFTQYTFLVNDAKTYGPSTSVPFFGYDLRKGCVVPRLKREFSQATIDLALNEWRGAQDRQARLTWLRHWCGIFQCFKSHMNHQSMESLHLLQRALSLYQKPDHEDSDSTVLMDFAIAVSSAFKDLCTMYLQQGVTPLFQGLLDPEDTLGTVVLTDANAKSFAGIIFRAARLTPSTDGLQSSIRVPVEFPPASALFTLSSDIPYILLPVKFVGAPFSSTDQRRSSTYRERYAVLDTVWQGRDVLAGEVVCLVDNANTMKVWADAAETLHGVQLTKFEHLQRNVHRFVWLRRNGPPRWADALARAIEDSPSTEIEDGDEDGSCVEDCGDVGVRAANASSSSNSDHDDPLTFCVVSFGLRRAFTAWKTSTPFAEVAAIPVNPSDARVWLAKAQESDEACQTLRKLVIEGKSKFRVDDDDLLRIGDKYVIPARYGKSVISRVHCFHGHPSVRQTLLTVARDFYVPGIGNLVQKVVSSCYCQFVRARRGPIRPVVSPLRGTLQVNDRWFMDTVGPLPESADHHYKHILSIQDAASSLVIFLPLTSTTTTSVTAAIEERVFNLLPPPRSITVDNASTFQSVAFKAWAASWGIQINFNPPYAAHRNGSLERQHGVLKQVLKCLCKGNVDRWPFFLPVAQRRCNSRAIYGDHTPHQLYFGLKDSSFFARRFEDVAASLDADSVRFEAKRRAARREAELQKVHQALDEAEADTLLKLAKSRRIVSRRRVFQIGQKVLKWSGPKPALGVNWSGPHVIVECCGPHQMTYRLSDGSVQESHNLCLYH
ncbi:gag/pol/env polyprotein, putative [Perkinsus marinus ATCC 50983]|uniref:Gag/pol/env polyprotein, putative n=1 Tax=Perkinsus marinus (strain ATCC 50983 / TXsc) TaxID=423536 RepID=C5LM16_PERM5|nr:gag/pol/env polyprotein, putative [Perkinsus marinus ATCC 50983]EER02227.1 gag/pol/env polyprotein, putative [Perkinsus marinus ATCC 50983]|eukprot:XP_002769509.1 gag/pol/env polyprotein, putative [Perkinsus marinus ATCC 50983]